MGWTEAADLIVKGMEGAINAKTVTYDFERLMEGAKLLKCGLPTCICPCLSISLAKVLTALPIG